MYVIIKIKEKKKGDTGGDVDACMHKRQFSKNSSIYPFEYGYRNCSHKLVISGTSYHAVSKTINP